VLVDPLVEDVDVLVAEDVELGVVDVLVNCVVEGVELEV
jgi:hypothetical protein